jgi:hypothetical protein
MDGCALPGVVNYALLLKLLNNPETELLNHLGQQVSPVNLSPGVYFYRAHGSPRYYRLVLIH